MATDSGSMHANNVGPAEFEVSPDSSRPAVVGLPHWERLPYPGLRAFHRDEMEIFFGREAALDAMVDRLGRTKFLAVLGPSGCGKSSLVRTGLYNALELGFLANAGGRWKIAELNPGRQPILNLARALAEAIGGETSEALVLAQLKRGPRSVVELGHGELLADGENLLIVVDQFEELFRFRDYAGREEAEAFVALLLESACSTLPIHVVITMRSEYIGACSLIPGLAEQISEGMFLTPRMVRDECREAIAGPSTIRGFDIEPELVARILNELQVFAPFDRHDGLDQAEQLALQADQLPLMQHLLNRMWRQAEAEHRPGRLVLTLHDYDEAGGLTGALDTHGREILAALEAESGPEIKVTVERVFRALVDGPGVALAVRCPRPLRNLVAAAGGEEKRAEVEKIVEAFRGPDCNFLRTSEPALDDDVIVDIGHESLIRRWTDLRQWFEAEVETRTSWNRLTQDSALWEKGEGGLLRDLGLRRCSDWWDRETPTLYTAQRYGGDFGTVGAFLKASEDAQGRRAKIEKQTRYGLRVAAVLVILVLGAFGQSWYFALQEVERQREEISRKGNESLFLANLASRYTISNLALRDNFARRFCGPHRPRSPESERCVDAGIAFLEQDYLALQRSLFGNQLPSVGNPRRGGAGLR